MTERSGAGSPPFVLGAEPSPDTPAAPHAVIIGGGLAGMAAASALADSPAQVTLLESRRRTGGRAGSFLEPAQQQEVDYCQHVAMGCCTNFWHLMKKHGLSDQFERVRKLDFLSLDGKEYRFASSRWLPAPLHFAPALGHLRFLSTKQRKEIRRAIWRLMRTPAERLDTGTFFETWLRAQKQSHETIQNFWNVVIPSALGEDVSRVAYAPARKVFIDGFLAARGAADVLVPRQALSQLFGELLPRSLQTAAVEIRTSTAAAEILTEVDRISGVRTGDGEIIPADRVIVAVPWHATGRLLPQSFSHFPASPITGVHLWFDRPITERKHVVLIGGLSQWLFRPYSVVDESLPRFSDSEATREERPEHYYQVVVSASHELQQQGQEASVSTICRELKSCFPAARQANLRRWRVVTDSRAVFSVSPQTESQRPDQTTGHPAIFLAGDYTRTGWPATMEGAVISGYRAADAVRRSLHWPGFPQRPPLPRSRLARWLIH